MEEQILTHNDNNNSLVNIQSDELIKPYINIINNLVHTNDLSDNEKDQYIFLLQEFSKFNLGKFLLQNRGLNGFWADYLINYPEIYKKTNKDPFGVEITKFEKLLLEKLPITTATQNRHRIFKSICQKYIENNIKLLSIPCGLSSEFLQLNYNGIDNIELIGIDIDPESLEISKQRATKLKLNEYCSWLNQDAWKYDITNLDLIISNGLTMYVDNDSHVQDLYNRFYNSLNHNGVLVTSFIVPPPSINPSSTWKMENLDPEVLKIQQVLFGKIFKAKWHSYRTEQQTIKLLTNAGFKAKNIIIHPDENYIFPTVEVRK